MDATPPKDPLLFKEESTGGESRLLNISLRGWIALIFVLTLCAIVLLIAFRVRDIEAVLPAIKDLFLPSVSLVVTFYFLRRQDTPPPPKA